MKNFSALLGDLKGVFGKAYLFAGLLPAVTLVFFANWYLSNETFASLVNGSVVSIEAEAMGEFAAAALLTLALGLIFFAARGWVLDTLQMIPGTWLRWINELLIHRQLSKRADATLDIEKRNHDRTVAHWADPKGKNFNQPVHLPTFERAANASEIERHSRRAIATFSKLRITRSRPPTAGECRRVLTGLRHLYAWAKENYNSEACTIQLRLWRLEAQKRDAERVLLALQDQAHRAWVDSARTGNNFPIENKWVGPTQLGSRSAALDDYAQERYGIDTSLLLSRLTGVLSAEDREGLSDSRLSVEALVNLAVVAALVALLVVAHSAQVIYAPRSTTDLVSFDFRDFAFLVAGVLSSIVCYRGALHAFDGLAEKTMRAVDLNRLALLKKSGFIFPADMGAERELWGQLSKFLAQGKPTLPVPDPPLREPE